MLDGADQAAAALASAVAGQYRLEREIGRGGMGVVYLATDMQLERLVAIKTLPPHLAADEIVRDRFLREARTAGGLSHQNIVPIYTAAERDGIVYFVMRYIAGESLAERLAKAQTLAPADVVAILRQIASALGYAHARGVVHRDIKAENVLLDADTGRAMLTDFGIARLAETKPMTATGTVLGTVHYMSPEQVTGEDLDGRSDLYALGVLAFLMLCGRFPFERNSPSAVLVAHVNSTPPRMCDAATHVAPALGEIVDRLLAKSRDSRFVSGDALRQALDALPPMEGSALVRANDSAPLAMLTPRDTPAVRADQVPAKLSSVEAQEVWARAAQLQANTGLHVPPAEFTSRAPGEALVTRGYDASLVKDSAREAGIDAKYVDRALAERARAEPVAIDRVSPKSSAWTFFTGAPVKFEYETVVEGELVSEGFEEIAEEVRKALGEMVTVSQVGRTMSIMTAVTSTKNGTPRRVQINIASRNGRTVIRGTEDLSQYATAMIVGLTAGGGFGAGSAIMGAVINATRNPALGAGAMFGSIGVAFVLSRFFYGRTARARDIELQDAMQRVAQCARQFVAIAPNEPPKRLR